MLTARARLKMCITVLCGTLNVTYQQTRKERRFSSIREVGANDLRHKK